MNELNEKRRSKWDLLIPKMLFGCLLLYLTWFSESYGNRPIILYALSLLLFASVALDMASRGRVYLNAFPKYLIGCILLAVYSFLIGLLIAKDRVWLISSLIRFVAYIGICYCMYYISLIDGSTKWFLKLFTLCGLVCAAQVVLFGFSTTSSGADIVVLSDESNPNTLGLVMLIAVFAVLFDTEQMKKRLLVKLLLVALFSYIIILTASRKCVLCLGLLLVAWVVVFLGSFKKERIKAVSLKTIVIIFAVLCGIGIAVYYLLHNFSDSGAFFKLNATLTSGSGTESRLFFYQEAWELFKGSPLVGVGYEQFRRYSSLGLYSHSTYAEIISCGGIIGTLLYMMPQIALLFGMIRQIILDKGRDRDFLFLFALLIIELVMSLAQITFYSSNHMLVLTFIFYWYQDRMQKKALAGGKNVKN